MNLKDVWALLRSSPSDILRKLSEGGDEPSAVARRILHVVNVVGANLGIIILLLSVYTFYVANATTCDQRFTIHEGTLVFKPSDFMTMRPSCLLACNKTIDWGVTVNKSAG